MFKRSAGRLRAGTDRQADLAELADAQDLGSCPARGMGSSPTIRTDKRR